MVFFVSGSRFFLSVSRFFFSVSRGEGFAGLNRGKRGGIVGLVMTKAAKKDAELIAQAVVADPGRFAERRDAYHAIVPNGQRCPVTGLKHGKLYELLSKEGAARGVVRVAHLVGPGSKRGITLFHVGDMLDFLDGLASERFSRE